MSERGLEHHVVWHCSQLASSEHASFRDQDGDPMLQGIVVLPRQGVPCHIAYRVDMDARWTTREAAATVTTPAGVSSIELTVEQDGQWWLDGQPAHHLRGCEDIDLGWSPSTNTPAMRRLALDVGHTAATTAAWVRFPELDVVATTQSYTRLAGDRWRFRSGPYDFELRTDAATGLVLAYGDDLWRAVAVSRGPVSP